MNMLPTKRMKKFEKGCQSKNDSIIYEKPKYGFDQDPSTNEGVEYLLLFDVKNKDILFVKRYNFDDRQM